MTLPRITTSVGLAMLCLVGFSASPTFAAERSGTMFMQKEKGMGVQVIPYVTADRHSVFLDFSATNLPSVEYVKYNLNYDTSKGLRGAEGMKWPLKAEYKQFKGVPYVRQHILLGTCSKNICSYDSEVKNFRLTVTTKYKGKSLEQTRVVTFN